MQVVFLRLDLRVECETPEHDTIRVAALFYFVLWTVGFPLLFLVLLLLARPAIVRGKDTALTRATSFLWREYRKEWLLWEVLDASSETREQDVHD